MLYLLHEAPPEEQNFSMIMEMLGSAQVKEDDEEYQSPLDILFERLETVSYTHLICRESIKYLWLEWWMLHNPLTNPRMYGSISGLSRNA